MRKSGKGQRGKKRKRRRRRPGWRLLQGRRRSGKG